jgi:hypothetical protein
MPITGLKKEFEFSKMSAGYSKKPLVEKLGIKPGFEVAFLNAPSDYAATIGSLPDGVKVSTRLKSQLDFVQIFATDEMVLEKKFPKSKDCLKENGMIWVSWPKVSSGLRSSITESKVRETGLKNGLVDVKICAIDATWSGLKFVRRVKDRSQTLPR